ncbi:hypothetical protein [Roseateles sp. MS654]|uniref:hypothetical protein n=1 Tax=Roseateles sp. MS654 TaxID=3412685 RepID=UPI003C2D8CB3
MSSSRKFGPTWLLMLFLACGLLGRPLHDAWHLVQPIATPAAMAVAPGIGATSSAFPSFFAFSASSDARGTAHDAEDDGEHDDVPRSDAKTEACAWCLFHGQAPAAAPGHAPELPLVHAEASPPPSDRDCGPVCSRDWTTAKPRGPPGA